MNTEGQLQERSIPVTSTGTKKRAKLTLFQVIKYFFVWGYAALTVGLFVWVTLTAFKSNREIFADPFGLPSSFNFENFVNAWNSANMSSYFLNSLIVAASTVILCIVLGSTVSFVIARFQFRGNMLLYALFIIGVTIPLQSLLLPIFFKMQSLGLRNTLLSLIIVYTALNLPKAVFILVGFMKSIPKELEEAAIIDGCNYWKMFYKVIMPISKPGISTVGILVFIAAWNEYVFATILVSADVARTLPLGLANFQTSYASNYGLIAAGVLISVIPVIIVYMILQEQIIKGMTAGAVKG